MTTFVYTLDFWWWSAIVADDFVQARDKIHDEEGKYPLMMYTEQEWEMMQ